eukprot:sb/3472028/
MLCSNPSLHLKGQHTPKLKLKLKFDVNLTFLVITLPFLGEIASFWACWKKGIEPVLKSLRNLKSAQIARRYSAKCNGLDALFPTSPKRSNFAKKWQSYDQKRQSVILILTLVLQNMRVKILTRNELDALFPTSPKRSNFAKKWQSYDQKPDNSTTCSELVGDIDTWCDPHTSH